VNLAMLYTQLGRNAEAETLLTEVVKDYPDLYDVQYSLGLLLAEEKKYTEAEVHLELAARGLPNGSRVHYNLGLLRVYLGKDRQAETALRRAVELEPENMDYLLALAQQYLKRGNFADAGKIADQMIANRPGDSRGLGLKDFLQMNSKK
jgi:Tfp pilus assembly protein PilF